MSQEVLTQPNPELHTREESSHVKEAEKTKVRVENSNEGKVPHFGGKKTSGGKKNIPQVRHKKVLKDNVQGITKPAIRRLARRGGVKRISGMIYEETRGVLKLFLDGIIKDAITYTQYSGRQTVYASDVALALKRNGRTLYGHGG